MRSGDASGTHGQAHGASGTRSEKVSCRDAKWCEDGKLDVAKSRRKVEMKWRDTRVGGRGKPRWRGRKVGTRSGHGKVEVKWREAGYASGGCCAQGAHGGCNTHRRTRRNQDDAIRERADAMKSRQRWNRDGVDAKRETRVTKWDEQNEGETKQ